MPKKFKVKVGKGGNVTVKTSPTAKRKQVTVKVKNRELSELSGRPL